MKHCKEHNGTFLSNTHRTSNHNKMGNNSNHIRNSDIRDMVKMASAIVQGQHSVVSMESLSQMWNIGLETVQQMLWVTTQHGVFSAIHSLNCRYRVDHLHFHHRQLNSTFYTDGFQSKVTSLRGNLHVQVYMNGKFTVVYPIPNKSWVRDTLRSFTNDFGIPDGLIADLAGEQTGDQTEFLRQIQQSNIWLHHMEKGCTRTRITVWNER